MRGFMENVFSIGKWERADAVVHVWETMGDRHQGRLRRLKTKGERNFQIFSRISCLGNANKMTLAWKDWGSRHLRGGECSGTFLQWPPISYRGNISFWGILPCMNSIHSCEY